MESSSSSSSSFHFSMCVVCTTMILSCSISIVLLSPQQAQAEGLRSSGNRRGIVDEDELFYNSFDEIKDAVENIENKQQQQQQKQQQPSYYEYAESLKYDHIDTTPDNIECLLSFHENNDDCYYNNGRVIFGTDIDINEQLIADGQCNFHPNLLHYKAECIEDIVDHDSGKSTTFNLVRSFCVENTCTICADPHDGSAFSMIDNNNHHHHQNNHDTDTNKEEEESVRPPVFISHHGSVFGVCALDPDNNGPDFTQMYLEFSGNCLSMETCRLKKDKNNSNNNSKNQNDDDDDIYNDDDNYAPDDAYTVEEINSYRKELNDIQLK